MENITHFCDIKLTEQLGIECFYSEILESLRSIFYINQKLTIMQNLLMLKEYLHLLHPEFFLEVLNCFLKVFLHIHNLDLVVCQNYLLLNY